MNLVFHRIALFAVLWLVSLAAVAEAHTCPIPGTAQVADMPKFITDDIALFWAAYDKVAAENAPLDEAARIYDTEYLERGSVGLRGFASLRIGSGKELAATVRALPRYYAALRADSLKVAQYTDAMRAAFTCLRQIYPDAVLPDVYFLIGRMSSAGTLDRRRLYIGVDMFGRDSADLNELGPWHRAVVGSISRLPYIVAHELVHFQQDYPRRNTLLGQALNEGIADFIAELISGGHINPHLHVFGDPREAELWAEFKAEMNGGKVENWLYQGQKAPPGKPADLGYYMGYKIAAAYYARAADKRQAVRDLLNIRDFKAFLDASGYDAAMAGKK